MNAANILEEISACKLEFLEHAKRLRTLEEVRSAARDTPEPADFAGALQGDGIALIAELKKASPSRGVIRPDFEPERIAGIYAENGARALSVLTDEVYFQGNIAHLQAARRVSGLPVLRKDFTVDPYQIYESRLIGADAVLLIAALMDGGQLEDFAGLGGELGLAVLVEVHTAGELRCALQAQSRLVGINNRDLRTFETNLETTFELLPRIPGDITTVSESGIGRREDVERLQDAGVNAMLVGESLMAEEDIGAKVRELLAS